MKKSIIKMRTETSLKSSAAAWENRNVLRLGCWRYYGTTSSQLTSRDWNLRQRLEGKKRLAAVASAARNFWWGGLFPNQKCRYDAMVLSALPLRDVSRPYGPYEVFHIPYGTMVPSARPPRDVSGLLGAVEYFNHDSWTRSSCERLTSGQEFI